MMRAIARDASPTTDTDDAMQDDRAWDRRDRSITRSASRSASRSPPPPAMVQRRPRSAAAAGGRQRDHVSKPRSAKKRKSYRGDSEESDVQRSLALVSEQFLAEQASLKRAASASQSVLLSTSKDDDPPKLVFMTTGDTIHCATGGYQMEFASNVVPTFANLLVSPFHCALPGQTAEEKARTQTKHLELHTSIGDVDQGAKDLGLFNTLVADDKLGTVAARVKIVVKLDRNAISEEMQGVFTTVVDRLFQVVKQKGIPCAASVQVGQMVLMKKETGQV